MKKIRVKNRNDCERVKELKLKVKIYCENETSLFLFEQKRPKKIFKKFINELKTIFLFENLFPHITFLKHF